jgi:hypothetical protein
MREWFYPTSFFLESDAEHDPKKRGREGERERKEEWVHVGLPGGI